MTLQLQKKYFLHFLLFLHLFESKGNPGKKKNEHKNRDSSLTCHSMKYHVNALSLHQV